MSDTREVSVGMLFAQARQVMREYEAASSQPRVPEAGRAESREYETAGAETGSAESANGESANAGAFSRD